MKIERIAALLFALTALPTLGSSSEVDDCWINDIRNVSSDAGQYCSTIILEGSFPVVSKCDANYEFKISPDNDQINISLTDIPLSADPLLLSLNIDEIKKPEGVPEYSNALERLNECAKDKKCLAANVKSELVSEFSDVSIDDVRIVGASPLKLISTNTTENEGETVEKDGELFEDISFDLGYELIVLNVSDSVFLIVRDDLSDPSRSLNKFYAHKIPEESSRCRK